MPFRHVGLGCTSVPAGARLNQITWENLIMRNLLLPVLLAIGLLAMGGSASAQLCGDVNLDSTINITDLVMIIEHISHPSPAPIDSANADCDGRAGVTISDMVNLSRFLFQGGTLNCNVTGSYSFGPTSTDTVFVPRMLNVPAHVDSVSLIVATSFDSTTEGFYLPMIEQGAGSNNLFSLNSVNLLSSDLVTGAGSPIGDTTVLWGGVLLINYMTGYNEFFRLNYVRVAPGVGYIVPELVNRSTLWQVAVEKGGDLKVPVALYVDAPLPQDTLVALPTELFFNANTGQPNNEHFIIDFVSIGSPVAFDVSPSQPWIVLDSVPPGGLVTPVSIMVSVNSGPLPEGTHNGQIDIVGVAPDVVMNTTAIAVTLTITTVNSPGDFNCDGQANIVDLMMFVNWLFLDGPPLPFCD